MVYEFRLPDIGEGVAQGEVVKWHVKVGDTVKEDQPLLSVLTDKANVEIPSPASGVVTAIHAKEGEMIKVGGLLVTIEAKEAAPRAAAPPPVPPLPALSPFQPSVQRNAPADRVISTPAVRRRAAELGVGLESVRGTGPGGRVTEADLENHVKDKGAAAAAPVPAARPPLLVTPKEHPLQERIPIRGIRRTIAEHMALTMQKTAHYTYVEEIDVTELVRVREHAKKRFEESGVPLSYLAFIVKSAVEALKVHPYLNAMIDDEKGEIVVCHYYNIGIATATPDGLIVSVIKDADKKSIGSIAREIQDLASRGKAGKLAREEMTGSTFTITSLGALGGLLATPILNYPEVAILGVHKIERRPICLPDGNIATPYMMNLSLTLDHRVIDGYEGAQFIVSIKSRLEDPHQLLLELR
jgi:pyruvate dehydrogenase E2 component (dihydrolipoamide acetyltransferase)